MPFEVTAMRRFTALLVLVASAGLALGCRDAVEKLLQPAPGTERQAESADARGPDSGAGLPGVASIGPAESLRVYFQYVDDRGAVRFVERMEDVPAAWRDRVGFIELDRLPPMAEPPVRDTYADARRAASPGGTGPRVVLYYADWCPWCKKAKDHLRKRGVDFVLRDVDEEEALEELIEKTGQSSIPVIDVNGKILKGYNANDLDQLLSS